MLLVTLPLMAQNQNPLTSYEFFTGTSGSEAVHTLAKTALKWSICNQGTTTDTIVVELNEGSVDVPGITIRAGKCVESDNGQFPLTSVKVVAGSGTPVYDILAFELP